MTDTSHAVEAVCNSALSQGAGKDRMVERFRFQTIVAAGGGGIGPGGPPGGVGGQVAFSGSHVMGSPSHELAQAHKGSRVHSGCMVLVPWCR